METIRRASVPGMRAKQAPRLVPSAAMKETEPFCSSELSAFSAIADSSGMVLSGRPIMLAWSVGAASTVPVAVDKHSRNARLAAEIAHHLRHPVEVDAGDDDGIDPSVDRRDRIGCHRRPARWPGEQDNR